MIYTTFYVVIFFDVSLKFGVGKGYNGKLFIKLLQSRNMCQKSRALCHLTLWGKAKNRVDATYCCIFKMIKIFINIRFKF